MNIKKILKPVLSIVLALVLGAFGSKNATAGTFVKTTTMIFVGLSYGFAYKCGLINIGIEGQLYMGGLFSAIAGIYLKLPMALHILVCLAAGFIGGAFWGGIVGWLKNRFKASEMITTVMMNYIAIYIVQYMVNGPTKEEKGTYPQSENILESAQLPLLVPKTQLTIGILIAVAAYAGMPVKKMVMVAMLVSGGLGGLAGSMEVLGVQHKIMDGLSAG